MRAPDARPTAKCPCGSGRPYVRCCQPFHEGRPAPTPEALMRSRYSAYAKGLGEYVLETTDPSGPQYRADREAWRDEVETFCRTTAFERLKVRSARQAGDEGEVVFHARLSQGGQDVSFSERSRFRRVDGRWLYHSGEAIRGS